MTLKDTLYRIDSRYGGLFEITMLEGHPVYEGHFPGNAVTPGVLTVAMVRECASLEAGRQLVLSAIKNCRFTAMIRPAERLIMHLKLSQLVDGYQLAATITGPGGDERLQLDATLKPEN